MRQQHTEFICDECSPKVSATAIVTCEGSSAETPAPKDTRPTNESSENTKPGTPNKRISWLVNRTKERLGSSTIFVGAPHKKPKP